MVESLAPMWDEQRARDHGATPPGGPPSRPRTPAPLCPAITEHVRAQFQARACEGTWKAGTCAGHA